MYMGIYCLYVMGTTNAVVNMYGKASELEQTFIQAVVVGIALIIIAEVAGAIGLGVISTLGSVGVLICASIAMVTVIKSANE